MSERDKIIKELFAKDVETLTDQEKMLKRLIEHHGDKVNVRVMKYTSEQIEENKKISAEISKFLRDRERHEEMSKNTNMIFD